MKKKVVIFGSCNLDMFFDVPNMEFFTNTGVGAEDALHFATHKQAPGGKGANQAVAAAKAGAKVHFFGAVGKGAHGRFVLENFRSVGIATKGVQVMNEPTGVAVIFNKPDGRHKLVVSHGANRLAKQKSVPDSMLGKNTILLFQAETEMKENAALMVRGHKAGATVILNVAPACEVPPKALKCVDYLILNQPEAEVVATSLGLDARDLNVFAKAMAEKFDLMCVITLGELGLMAMKKGDEKPLHVPSLAIKAIDTIGAGDAFCGAFAAALADGKTEEEALRHGAVAGSLACTRVGAQTALPSVREIAKNVRRLGASK
jgi:ribokinase